MKILNGGGDGGSDGESDGESGSESDGESDGPGPPVQPSFLEPQCPLTGTKK